MDTALRALAERARGEPAILSALGRSDRVAAVLTELGRSEAGRSFRADLGRFLAEYGHRSYSLDIARPSFAAEPSQLLRLLVALAQSDAPQVDQVARRERAMERARRVIGASPLGFLRWPLFTRLLHLTQAYVRLREDERFAWQSGLALLRRVCLVAGELLVARGELADAADLFYLQRNEVDAALESGARPGDLREIIRTRRAEYRALLAEHERAPAEAYPRFLVDGRPLLPEAVGGRSLRGQPASPGRVSGPVRIVLSPDELPDVRLGEILVTRGADPGWTPLFGRIGGLVMESGGQLSHGSVVAREYGIPAVVGVAGATADLRDGEVVILDGEAGTVTRLGEPAA